MSFTDALFAFSAAFCADALSAAFCLDALCAALYSAFSAAFRADALYTALSPAFFCLFNLLIMALKFVLLKLLPVALEVETSVGPLFGGGRDIEV